MSVTVNRVTRRPGYPVPTRVTGNIRKLIDALNLQLAVLHRMAIFDDAVLYTFVFGWAPCVLASRPFHRVCLLGVPYPGQTSFAC